MQLDIKKVQKGGKAVLANTGYWGICLKTGERYDLRCYVKSANYKGTITARLQDGATGQSLGARNVLPTGKVITLRGDANDENTFEQPTKLAPRTTLFGKFGKQFDYEFSPMSFTVMRVKVSK